MSGRTDLKKGTKETFGGDGYDYYFDFGDGWTDACICKLYTSNMWNLFYINYNLNKAV